MGIDPDVRRWPGSVWKRNQGIAGALRVKRARALGRRCPRWHGPLGRLHLGRLGRFTLSPLRCPDLFSKHTLDYAQEDLDYGLLGVGRYPRAAAWSFQQATEKALKACLIHSAKLPPRTHDLVLLLNLQGFEFSADMRTNVLLLAEINTASRYPDDAEPVSEALALEYAEACQRVLAYVKTCIHAGKSGHG